MLRYVAYFYFVFTLCQWLLYAKNVQEFIVRMCEQTGTFILTQLVCFPWDVFTMIFTMIFTSITALCFYND